MIFRIVQVCNMAIPKYCGIQLKGEAIEVVVRESIPVTLSKSLVLFIVKRGKIMEVLAS